MFLLKNTYTKKEFIQETLWYAFALFTSFHILCFISLPSLSVIESKCILFAIMLVTTAACTALSFKRGRNSASLWINSLIPLGAYAAIAYMPYFKKGIIILTVSAAVMSAIFVGIMLFCRDVKLGTRIKAGMAGTRAVVAICTLLLILPMGMKTVFGHGFLLDKSASADGYSESDEWTFDNNFETLTLLKEENWKNLGIKEKMTVLATVKNIEICHLGIDHEIYLEVDELEEGNVGFYEPRFRKLMFDIRHLENGSAAECLNTVLHECYHAYQHMIAELYVSLPENYKNLHMFDAAEDYVKELFDYNDGTKDMLGYYAQRLESDAYSYAREAVKAYYGRIGD